MVIVLGSVTIKDDALDQALAISQEHVSRSRQEAGCISHAVHLDAENQSRLVFVEQWQDMDALQQHFRVPESGEFVQALSRFATSEPQMKIFNASEIQRH